MAKSKFPEEFKLEAVRQVNERGYSASDVAKRLGVIVVNTLVVWSLNTWCTRKDRAKHP